MIYSCLIYFFLTIFSFQEGDILFQDSDCGPFCEAIEKVTTGYKGARLSHVGMLIKINGEWKVIEAISKGVVLTPLDSFLIRAYDDAGNPKVLVGRLQDEFKPLISDAKVYMLSLVGHEYDDVFDINNDRYYCSELLYEGFKSANQGKDVFHLFPMTFKDPDTKLTFNIWEYYFKELNCKIPENELGLNPGGISRSDKIDIIKILGVPKGMVNE
jgi:hypothetical protein